ncbi:MAG: hypothetical protein P4K94_10575 [Terracidiphilus sp.]|nr:hypothetical protein [Terracidiphilus sp.]
MLLKKLQKYPEKMVPVGMTLLTTGLMMLVIGIFWPQSPFLAHLAPDWNDFLRGFLFGIAIVLETLSVVVLVSAVANKRKEL